MDTLRTVKDLQAAGIAPLQAEAIVQAIGRAISDDLVHKDDLPSALSPIKTDLAVLKWMMGFTLAALVAILTRIYG